MNHLQKIHRVNLNDLFDQDEKFLYSNPYFRAMIKNMCQNFAQHVNPNFEINQITNETKLQQPKYDIPKADQPYNSSDFARQYNALFKASYTQGNPYPRMIINYSKIF